MSKDNHFAPNPALADFLRSLPEFPLRKENGHKGNYGHVFLVGGSRGMSGSIALAGKAALAAGSGLVHLAVPESILNIVASYAMEYMIAPLPSDPEGKIDPSAQEMIIHSLNTFTAGAIGPGLGRIHNESVVLRSVLQNVEKPVVFDADALNALAPDLWIDLPEGELKIAGTRIFTPHPGEFARLTGEPIPQTEEERKNAALRFVQSFKDHYHFSHPEKDSLILILKGHRTIITDGQNVYINETGNPGMATGGSGDVLTGILVSLIGQIRDPLSAVRLAVALHGLAGDCAAKVLEQESITASSLILYFSDALRLFRSVRR
ncbi:MAG: NAD(P)H-hydrate dehydratase [Planctomycetia bacterium]|nr:NAD(P)H-hydrate dehydratase [Planctomycetia bacterium]